MLARSGVPVTLIGRAPHVEAIARDGLLIDGLRVHDRVRVSASTELSAVRDARLVLFCVKTTDTETAARALLPHPGAFDRRVELPPPVVRRLAGAGPSGSGWRRRLGGRTRHLGGSWDGLRKGPGGPVRGGKGAR